MPEETKNLSFPIPLQQGTVYGPLHSKRLGKSLGINILPSEYKVCNLDCLYCFYGRTNFRYDCEHCPPMDALMPQIEEALKSELEFDYITFSGNGSAALHPQFPEIVRRVVELRDNLRPGIPVAILSNSTGLEKAEIRETFKLFDLPIMKLDTADEIIFRKLNRPRQGVKIAEIIEQLSEMRGITIQALFADGEIVNFKGKELEDWMKAVIKIKPESVQIYTIDRDLPQQGLIKLSNEILFRLADYISNTTKILVKAFVDKA